MTSITTIVKHRVRTTGSEHQGQNSISDPDQNLGFICIFHQVCKNIHGHPLTVNTHIIFQPSNRSASSSRLLYICLKKISTVRFDLVWFYALCPGKQFFSHVGTEPPLPGYYQYFLGGKYALLKDTTRRPEWGSNPRPLDPESEVVQLGSFVFRQTDKGKQCGSRSEYSLSLVCYAYSLHNSLSATF